MKLFLPLLFVLALFVPSAMAHGGAEKRSGPITAYYSQDPLSPLVGETVRSTFVLRDDLGHSMANWPVTVTLIDTFYGDESKDTQVLARLEHTDANGSVTFEYVFTKENYFDLEVGLHDRSGEDQTIGFLIQPRNAVEKVVSKHGWLLIGFATLVLIGALGWLTQLTQRLTRRSV